MFARLVGLLLLCALGTPLFAQSGSAARLAGRFAPTDAVRLGSVIDSLVAEGAPAEPLLLKAVEGASKGAAADRVAMALRNLGRALVEARGALGGDASAGDVAAAAGALRAGARPATLATLRSARPSESLAVPLGTLADLLARGVPADRAEAVIMQLVQRKAPDAEFGLAASAVADAAGGSNGNGQGAGGGKANAGGARSGDGRSGPPGQGVGVPGNGGARGDPPGKATPNPGNPGNSGGRGKPENVGSGRGPSKNPPGKP